MFSAIAIIRTQEAVLNTRVLRLLVCQPKIMLPDRCHCAMLCESTCVM